VIPDVRRNTFSAAGPDPAETVEPAALDLPSDDRRRRPGTVLSATNESPDIAADNLGEVAARLVEKSSRTGP